MEPIVIDSIRMAANDCTSPALRKIAEESRAEDWTELNALGELLKPLRLDYDLSEKIMEQAINIAVAGDEAGFRRGFRIAARLMVESLCAPKAPETGGGA